MSFEPTAKPMNAEEIAKFRLAFIEDQIRAGIRGTLGRDFIVCGYCASENHIGADLWCCELMANASNAVLERIEQEQRNEVAARALEEDARRPLVTLN
jgi:hypothetical protein